MNFPVIMLGEPQDTEIDLDVMFNTRKFWGGSSGAAINNETYKDYCRQYILQHLNMRHKLND